MNINNNFSSKLCGIIATLSILFLPVFGYRGNTLNGIGLIFKNVQSIYVLISVLCSILICFFKIPLRKTIVAIIGISTLFIGYFVGKNLLESLYLAEGFYIFILCLGVSIWINTYKDKNFLQNISTIKKQEYSVADELLKYKNLLDQGAITQNEFEEQKTKLLNQSK